MSESVLPEVGGGETPPAIAIRSLSKTFSGGRGLKDVDLTVRRGTVHALLGQNGSGKSTLIKILAGVYQPDPGAEATCAGAPLRLGSGTAARACGIRFIHQDLGLIADLDVTDNLALGAEYSARWWLSDRRERSRARALLSGLGIDVDPAEQLGSLPQASQSMVAIARALGDDDGSGRLIVLDEPTAALQAEEVAHLFTLINTLRAAGNTILYVTHRLEEVFEIADDVTVLRDGRRVATEPVSNLDHDSLVELIIVRSVEAFYPEPPAPGTDTLLAVEGVSGMTVHDVSFQLRRGEIVGLAGLLGSGYEELLFLIAGGQRRESGTVTVAGVPVPPGDPQAAIAAGIAFAPADRKKLSAIPSWSLRENITLPLLRPVRNLWMSDRAEGLEAQTWLDKVHVDFSADALFSTLSGGNQQRVVIAKWLRTQSGVILLQEPTNGVDTGAKQSIYAALGAAARSGTSVLISSSDAEELCAICDRVIVLNGGSIGSVLEGQSLTVDRLLTACMSRSDRTTTPDARESEITRVHN